MLALLLLLLPAEGRPLFPWGARTPVLAAESRGARPEEARVTEVYAARDAEVLVLRFGFDRPVRDALYLADGTPVSGRLRAVLYLDGDDDRATGLDEGERDLRTGADRRLEIGVVSVGEDPEEEVEASAVVSATLVSLTREGRRRTLWQRDDAANPDEVSAHGEWVELRVPADRAGARPGSRIVLTIGGLSWEGRLQP